MAVAFLRWYYRIINSGGINYWCSKSLHKLWKCWRNSWIISLTIWILEYLLVEHIVKVIVAIMAGTLEDFEGEIWDCRRGAKCRRFDSMSLSLHVYAWEWEKRLSVQNISTFCSSLCHGDDFGRCTNKRRVQESDNDQTVSLCSKLMYIPVLYIWTLCLST